MHVCYMLVSGPRPGKNGPYYPNAPYPYGQNTTRSGEIPLMPNPTSSSFQGTFVRLNHRGFEAITAVITSTMTTEMIHHLCDIAEKISIFPSAVFRLISSCQMHVCRMLVSGPRPGTNGPFYTNPTSSPSQGTLGRFRCFQSFLPQFSV